MFEAGPCSFNPVGILLELGAICGTVVALGYSVAGRITLLAAAGSLALTALGLFILVELNLELEKNHEVFGLDTLLFNGMPFFCGLLSLAIMALRIRRKLIKGGGVIRPILPDQTRGR